MGSVMLDRLLTSTSSSVFTWGAEKGADGDWEQGRVGFSWPRTAERGQSPSADSRTIRPQSWYTRRSEFKAGTRTSLLSGTRPYMKPTCVKKGNTGGIAVCAVFLLALMECGDCSSVAAGDEKAFLQDN